MSEAHSHKGLNAFIIICCSLAAGLFAFVGYQFLNATPASQALSLSQNNFKLISNKSGEIESSSLIGKPAAIFFGYTHCPDICPVTLNDVSVLIEEMGDKAKDYRFGFVTVDPKRDTPEVLADYMKAFNDQIIGISGEPEQIEKFVRSLGAYSRLGKPDENGAYYVDHSSSIHIYDRKGNFTGRFNPMNPNDNLPDLLAAAS